jgi:hypothetical protein
VAFGPIRKASSCDGSPTKFTQCWAVTTMVGLISVPVQIGEKAPAKP